MRPLHGFTEGLKGLVRKGAADRDLDEELQAYREMSVEHKVRSGMSRKEALRAVRLEMGSLDSIKEQVRDVSWESRLETFWLDLRHSLRSLLRDPGFLAIALLTLTLGIGASTAIFSIVDGVLLRPLPFPGADRLVAIWETDTQTGRRYRVPPGNYEDWRQEGGIFEESGLYGSMVLTLSGEGDPQRILGAQVDGGYFRTLGLTPLVGRYILKDDARAGAPHVVVLSYSLWQRRFGGARDAVGRVVRFDGESYQIIGVMPPGPYPTWPATTGGIVFQDRYQQFWVPMQLGEFGSSRTSHVFGVVGRLKEGVSLGQAQAAMDILASGLALSFPEANKGEGILVTRMADEMTGTVRPALVMLLSAVGLLLLVGCSNLGTLFLARATDRMGELAVRAALGATRGRLLRQLLLETTLLALTGGLLGALLAGVALPTLLAYIPSGVPRLGTVTVDTRALGFALILSAATVLLFGTLPALQVTGRSLQDLLRGEGRSRTSTRGRERTRCALVTIELAVACVLLIGAGLLGRSYARLSAVELGFEPTDVMVAELSLPVSATRSRKEIFQKTLLERLGNLPGTRSVAVAYDDPCSASWTDSFEIPGRPMEDASAWLRIVSPAYLETLRIPLRRGRAFTETDDGSHPRVVQVNEAFVHRFFDNQDPLGKVLVLPAPTRPAPAETHEIVGIVADVRFLGPSTPGEPAIYVPVSQFPQGDFSVLLRTTSTPEAAARGLRDTVRSIDGDVPLGGIAPMAEILDRLFAQARLNALLLGLFGVLAFLLAALGIYGLLAYTVGRRTREIGVRLALGANPRGLTRMILKRTLLITAIGVSVGLAISAFLSHLLGSLLFQVAPFDPATFVAAATAVGIVSMLASWVPARRAAGIDPVEALRDS